MNSPLVSIIVPAYNCEAYLERCLDSIAAQNYPNFEVVAVDDGSTDSTGAIIDRRMGNDSRLTVVHTANQGASLARKTGLEKCRGSFVAFVDADDYVSACYISELMALIREYDCGIAACGVQKIPATEAAVFHSEYDSRYILGFDQLMPRFFKYEFWGYVGKIYSKDLFSLVEIPKATLSEDYNVMCQLFLNERRMAYTPSRNYVYEMHPGSLSNTRLGRRAFEEWDNVKAVYDRMRYLAPEYADYAFSNVVETAVKLLSQQHNDTDKEFKEQFKQIKTFLRQNIAKVLTCTPLLWKVRVEALYILLFR